MTGKEKPCRQRLDLLILNAGLLPSREAAQAAIMDGGIMVNGKLLTKPGTSVSSDAKIELVPNWGPPKYVSRGGLKLEKALAEFSVDINGYICLDIGASTGGFTDCLLKHGAAQVYAIDVGYGQLDWKLRNDSRVIVKERLNARYLKETDLYLGNEPRADLVVIDVSFISVAKILPVCPQLLKERNGNIISLIKPQFESNRKEVSKGGVVKSPAVHVRVINEVFQSSQKLGFYLQALTFSPIKGPAGNIEYLAYFQSGKPLVGQIIQTNLLAGLKESATGLSEQIERLVNYAHQSLN